MKRVLIFLRTHEPKCVPESVGSQLIRVESYIPWSKVDITQVLHSNEVCTTLE